MNINEEFFIDLTKKLLNCIDKRDWEGYVSLTDENLSCIEPETGNKIVVGLDFHKFFFTIENIPPSTTFTSIISDPHVKILGNTACVSYYRVLAIHEGLADKPMTRNTTETRIWNFNEKTNSWKQVHYHKS